MQCNKTTRPRVDEDYEECRDGIHVTDCLFLSAKVNALGFDINPDASLTEVFNVMFERILRLEKEIRNIKNI